MSMIYRTVDGDVVDRIAIQMGSGMTAEAIYTANPGLADHGAVLPSGVLITIPDMPAPKPLRKTLRLWG